MGIGPNDTPLTDEMEENDEMREELSNGKGDDEDEEDGD
jgi:hypothetical protein